MSGVTSAIFRTMALLGSQDRPLPLGPIQVGRKARRHLGVPVGSHQEALADLKAPEIPDHQRGIRNSSSSGKATPAAVCLVASMLASVASGFAIDPAKVCCPSIGIRFSDEVDVHRIAARGNMWPNCQWRAKE